MSIEEKKDRKNKSDEPKKFYIKDLKKHKEKEKNKKNIPKFDNLKSFILAFALTSLLFKIIEVEDDIKCDIIYKGVIKYDEEGHAYIEDEILKIDAESDYKNE